MTFSKISLLSKLFLGVTAILFFCSLLFPMWQIDLDAPQYPEGLVLKLHAHKIGGDVEIINGLNHYIGMKTLHTENFVEFKILPYIIGFFGIVSLLMVFFSNKKCVIALFVSFLLFGVLAGLDFYRWNYDYGHDLDPHAAIQVPGMAYQPPLIGYKQLLNFGAYSIPDTGGWMLFAAGLLLLMVIIKETNLINRFRKPATAGTVALFASLIMFSCNTTEPKPIKLNSDSCEFCKMTISNGKFGAEVITQKGRHYKFDDMSCMGQYVKANTQVKYSSFYVNDYLHDNTLIPAENSFYLKGGDISSPMRGNIAAFSTQKEANEYKQKLNADTKSWAEIFNAY
ncbi:nitrous oxide reductase accessory protein NosL [Flavobacterium sp. DGU11]|uniref:Nitrous oxide reductase accessory protein NosL n=1 Tax=Flavobacterium arundinis TaxID=3139143 RepID=A0ABU9HUH2_9FLAO